VSQDFGGSSRIFHIGGYWRRENDIVRQMMLGLRQAGFDVFEFNTDEHRDALETDGRAYDRGALGPVWLNWDHLRDPLEEFRPDLVICNAGGLSFRPETATRLRERMPLMGIALSDPEVFEASTSRVAPNFDRFYSNAASALPRYQELGVDARLLPVATNEEFFHPVDDRQDLHCDVLIIGSPHQDRIEPVRSLSEVFDVHVYGDGWKDYGIPCRGLIFGEDSLAALNSAKATIVFSKTRSGYPNIKVGLFDFLAAGALVITDYQPELAAFFELEREIVTFSSTSEMLAKVAHLVAHPEIGDQIRKAGRERVLREHTWRRVWPKILQGFA